MGTQRRDGITHQPLALRAAAIYKHERHGGGDVTNRRVLVFRLMAESDNESPRIMAVPEDQIRSITAVYCGRNLWCDVNGTRTQEAFDSVIRMLGKPTPVCETLIL